ncbi:MAG: hypothetical protein M1818_000517 [Claussenomyces sp. TS43310]|nr:MAG: hypothetical protein M1818_000517 [Claussenomyces sp. TS43310]
MEKSAAPVDAKSYDAPPSYDVEHGIGESSESSQNPLARDLKGRHMQMIAIGGAIGAGLFVGSGSALSTGGPGSVLLGWLIVGGMLLCTVQALGEMAVLYPVNGAFFTYVVRFVDPSWGFAVGWDYALGWLTVLPFEITAASITIQFWDPGNKTINIGVWITIFLLLLCAIQFFGVRGYGEVEFVLSIIKIVGCIGFIILGIIIDCGGVPTDNRGYIGAKYWHDPGAFRNGFKGFCSVFVTAAFSFGGTELVGLAAAEAADPRKSIPKATKQVFWRISLFYVLSLFLIGLIVPSDSPDLLNATGANTKYSPFVIAMNMAGIKILPSIFNAIITISVISVANSCTFGSSRTIQALAQRGMAPKFLAYVDKKGRPLPTIILQLCFGLLAFINESTNTGSKFFDWLLALSGLQDFFIWGSICLAHIRFRKAWRLQGHTLEELPYQAGMGLIGSWIGLFLNCICLVATFYVAIWPPGSSPSASYFFQQFLAGPLILFFYFSWKLYSREWKFCVRTRDMDLDTGRRSLDLDSLPPLEPKTWKNFPLRLLHGLF